MTPDIYLRGLIVGFFIFLLIGALCKKSTQHVVSTECAQTRSIDVDREDAIDILRTMGYSKEDSEERVDRARLSKPNSFNELVNRAIRSYESNY